MLKTYTRWNLACRCDSIVGRSWALYIQWRRTSFIQWDMVELGPLRDIVSRDIASDSPIGLPHTMSFLPCCVSVAFFLSFFSLVSLCISIFLIMISFLFALLTDYRQAAATQLPTRAFWASPEPHCILASPSLLRAVPELQPRPTYPGQMPCLLMLTSQSHRSSSTMQD